MLTFLDRIDKDRPTNSGCKGKIRYYKSHWCSQDSLYICLIHIEYNLWVWLQNKATKQSFFTTFIKSLCRTVVAGPFNSASRGMDTKDHFAVSLQEPTKRELFVLRKRAENIGPQCGEIGKNDIKFLTYWILTNFRAYLISRNRQIRFSRGFNFAISEKKGLEGFKILQKFRLYFRVFCYIAKINTRENKWE